MLSREETNTNVFSPWFDLTGVLTHDLPDSRWACYSLFYFYKCPEKIS
jgi:hypothetical protein